MSWPRTALLSILAFVAALGFGSLLVAAGFFLMTRGLGWTGPDLESGYGWILSYALFLIALAGGGAVGALVLPRWAIAIAQSLFYVLVIAFNIAPGAGGNPGIWALLFAVAAGGPLLGHWPVWRRARARAAAAAPPQAFSFDEGAHP